jgi:hypothetical protein
MRTLTKILLPLAGMILAAIAVLGVILVGNSRPSGHFEGHWEGGFVIKSDSGNRYEALINTPLSVTIDINEQSSGYGHIRLRTREGIPFEDMILPCRFTDGGLFVETETVSLTGTRTTEHGTPLFDAVYTIRDSDTHENPTISGEISCRMITSQPELFK